MLQTLRARLTAVSVLVVSLALAVLSGIAFVVVRANVLEMLDERIGGMTRLYANELSDWAQTNQRIAGSIKAAVPLATPFPPCWPPSRPVVLTMLISSSLTTAASSPIPCLRATAGWIGPGSSRANKRARPRSRPLTWMPARAS